MFSLNGPKLSLKLQARIYSAEIRLLLRSPQRSLLAAPLSRAASPNAASPEAPSVATPPDDQGDHPMAANLVSSVMQCLTPDLVAKIARTLGIDPELAQKVVTSAVPAILARFGGRAAKPAGAQQLSNALEQQHPDRFALITDAI